jgi:UDP-N-acetylenolpyruvoylglucosamine reductase
VAQTFAVTYPARTLALAIVAGTSELTPETKARMLRLADEAERSGSLPGREASVRAYLPPAFAEAHPEEIAAEMAEIKSKREKSQPRNRTGGSTFKNPPGASAWQLVDAAGCRGLKVGQAKVSELHSNFLITLEGASAADIETLGETVRARVKAHSGIDLEWEIKRIGIN